ncbi:hypothetical protein GGI11_008136, partial [Coemansia sp. RSA 2049]
SGHPYRAQGGRGEELLAQGGDGKKEPPYQAWDIVVGAFDSRFGYLWTRHAVHGARVPAAAAGGAAAAAANTRPVSRA